MEKIKLLIIIGVTVCITLIAFITYSYIHEYQKKNQFIIKKDIDLFFKALPEIKKSANSGHYKESISKIESYIQQHQPASLFPYVLLIKYKYESKDYWGAAMLGEETITALGLESINQIPRNNISIEDYFKYLMFSIDAYKKLGFAKESTIMQKRLEETIIRVGWTQENIEKVKKFSKVYVEKEQAPRKDKGLFGDDY